MLKSLKQLFRSESNAATPSDYDLKLATATLMVELIRSDGEIYEGELKHMRNLLEKEFDLDADTVVKLIEDAQESANEAISLQGFTREICEHWDNSKRIKMIEYLWVIALADDRIDPEERHLVRKLAGLLYVNEREIQIAKIKAMEVHNIKQE